MKNLTITLTITIPNPKRRITTTTTKSLILITILKDSWLTHTAPLTTPPTCTLTRKQLPLLFRQGMKLEKSPP